MSVLSCSLRWYAERARSDAFGPELQAWYEQSARRIADFLIQPGCDTFVNPMVRAWISGLEVTEFA